MCLCDCALWLVATSKEVEILLPPLRPTGGTGMVDNVNIPALLQRVSFLARLSLPQLQELSQVARSVPLRERQSLALQGTAGEALYMVVDGLVKLVHVSPGGGEVVWGVFDPGSYVGELALFTDVFDSHRLVALLDSRLIKLERQALRCHLQSRGEVAFSIVQGLADELQRKGTVLVEYSQPLPMRLARYLTALAHYHGVITTRGLVIDLPLQVSDLQEAVGAREGELVAVLRSFVAREILDLSRSLLITNLDQLRRLALGTDE